MPKNREIGGNCRRNPLHFHFLKRSNCASNRRWAILTPHDEFADQVVVVLADLITRLVAGVKTNTEPTWRLQRLDRAGRRQELATGRILRINADLDSGSVATGNDLFLGHRQRFARRNPNLPLDEIDSGDLFGDRVLDLKAGIHFKEEELSLLVDELDGSCVVIADSLRCLHCGLTHRFLNTIGQARSWSLFNELLVATLRRAVTSGDPHHVALRIAHQLNLDMARPGEVTLDVDLVTTEEGFRFTLRTRHCVVDLVS